MTGRLLRPTDQGLQRQHRARTRALEESFDVDQSDLRPARPTSGGPHPADFVVAPSDSAETTAAGADFVCSGTGDATAIQDVMDEAASKAWGGAVLLLPGLYDWDALFTVPNGCTLFGCGTNTHLEGSGGSFVMGDDSKLLNLMFRSDGLGATDWAIDNGGNAVVDIHDVWLFDLGSSYGVNAGEKWSVAGCHLWGYGKEAVRLAGPEAMVAACEFLGGGVHTIGSDGVISSSTFDSAIECIHLAGNGNLMSGCNIVGAGSPTNTKDIVTIEGTQESFVHNRVSTRNTTLHPRYAVNILGTATGARVKYNDLRAASTGAWGTAPLLDSGVGSLVASND